MGKLLYSLLLTLMVGCKADVTSVSLYMGDSLVALSSSVIVAKAMNTTEGATLPIVNGISCSAMSMPYWEKRVQNIQERVSLDNAFVSLGSNDMANGTSPVRATLVANASKIMAAFKPSVNVYWVLPSHAQQPEYVPMVRKAIEDAAAGYPNVQVIDFEEYLRSRGMQLSDVLGNDGIHWSNSGQHVYGEFLVSYLEYEG